MARGRATPMLSAKRTSAADVDTGCRSRDECSDRLSCHADPDCRSTASGYRLPSTTIEYFAAGAPSYVTGLEKGDTVLRVGDTTVHTGYELAYEIMFSGYKPIDVLVERNGDRVLVENVRFPTEAAQGVALGNMDFQTAPLEPTAWNVVRAGFWRGVSSIKMAFDSLKGIVTGRFGFSDLSAHRRDFDRHGSGAPANGRVESSVPVCGHCHESGVFNLLPHTGAGRRTAVSGYWRCCLSANRSVPRLRRRYTAWV